MIRPPKIAGGGDVVLEKEVEVRSKRFALGPWKGGDEVAHEQFASPLAPPFIVGRIEEVGDRNGHRALGRPGHSVLGIGPKGGINATISCRTGEQLT